MRVVDHLIALDAHSVVLHIQDLDDSLYFAFRECFASVVKIRQEANVPFGPRKLLLYHSIPSLSRSSIVAISDVHPIRRGIISEATLQRIMIALK